MLEILVTPAWAIFGVYIPEILVTQAREVYGEMAGGQPPPPGG